ncbi:hypothetical protein AB0F17_47620 [Nonomuraea sp. NPDC026600]|uniref:hypothetical protein n=1 Tax=Nonomuraea sp. NPDC026600 TaxID=3155363 RepID=UPI00340A5365
MGVPLLKPGLITTRVEMAKLFGGGQGHGIQPCRKTPSVLIYSDPERGEQSGYHDGWLKEEDEFGPIFEYTGHGEGDQTFVGRDGSGNRAILCHVDEGRALYVFKATGKARDFKHLNVARSSGMKAQRYVGPFELDTEEPYAERVQPNKAGVPRRVIVFRLRPIGDFPREAADEIPPAGRTQAIQVPADVTTSSLVRSETNRTTTSVRSAIERTKAERREAKLSADFQVFLEAQHHRVMRFEIRVKGLSSTLLTDLYDVTAHVLFEAKGTSSRKDMRMAIGQLLDYRRHVTPKKPALAVLLPEEPNDDLRELLSAEGIGLVYRDGDSFGGWPVDR